MRTALGLVLVCALGACAAALHVVRSIADIADDLCVATLSDPHLDPEVAKLLAGRTAQVACKDNAIAREFVDQVKVGSQKARWGLRDRLVRHTEPTEAQ